MRPARPWYRRPLAAARALFDISPDTRVFNDGWENKVTGLGAYNRDKSMHAHFERKRDILSLDWPLLDALYHEDDVSGRIIDLPADHMFRKGYSVHVSDDTDKKKSKAFTKYAKKLQVRSRAKLATKWGRKDGGALLLLGIDDNRSLDQPVDEGDIKSIKYLNVIERQYAIPETYYTDVFDEKCNEVATYRIMSSQVGPTYQQPSDMVSTFIVHESRVVRFEGATTNKHERQKLHGWTHTVLLRPYEKVKAFVQAFQAAGNLMTDASQGVYKLEGLMGQISSGEKDALEMRMMMMDMGRSVARSIILDKDGEEFERTIAAISGYPDMLDRFMMLLSAATEIPVTLLMGRSAAGMNATGDSDFRQFYDVIESKQVDDLEPQLQRIYRYISLAKDGPTQGVEVEITFKFRSLWSPTIMEHAQINLAQSSADLNNITAGVYTAEEVALSRSGDDDGDIHLDTKIDIVGRQTAQKSATHFDPYENEPEPEPGATPGDLSLKGQGGTAPAPATRPITGARGDKKQSVNSSQPGDKPGSGR